ncbi:MAG: hypothetical protein FIA95_12610, partial [Gemmatimonadetes bacterium]|nr:hypothetical protein [Gemmatimonadota bacterium]
MRRREIPGPGSAPGRREFLRAASLGAAAVLLRPDRVSGQVPFGDGPEGSGGTQADEIHLVILHTNDTHSRIDPFPMDGGPYQGLGGVARRAILVERVREAHPNVLLLDSGDIFQGTPYFNFFGGEIEFRAMSAMGYDASTLGNHDFDNGVSGLVEMLPHASFPFVSANYEVEHPELGARVEPWVVRD